MYVYFTHFNPVNSHGGKSTKITTERFIIEIYLIKVSYNNNSNKNNNKYNKYAAYCSHSFEIINQVRYKIFMQIFMQGF
jgi:hypothetical protein